MVTVLNPVSAAKSLLEGSLLLYEKVPFIIRAQFLIDLQIKGALFRVDSVMHLVILFSPFLIISYYQFHYIIEKYKLQGGNIYE